MISKTGVLVIAPDGPLALSWERRRMDALVEFLETHHPDLTADPAWQTFAGLAVDYVSEAAEHSDPGASHEPTANPSP